MTRIFIQNVLTDNEIFILEGEESHYVSSVLRMRKGELLTVVDSTGKEKISEIVELNKDTTGIRVVETRDNESEPPVKITLYQSISKGERMDLTIQKSVELGVTTIVPVFSERCVVRPEKDAKASAKKTDRRRKIALEAARQSGRGIVPDVTEPVLFEQALKDASANNDLVLFPWEEEHGKTLKEVLEGSEAKRIAVFIGPEGGFTEEEAHQASEHNAHPVTLGRRILRTETAGPAVLAMLLYHTEL